MGLKGRAFRPPGRRARSIAFLAEREMKPARWAAAVLCLCAAAPALAQCPTSYIGNGCTDQDWSGIESALPGAQLFGAWQLGMPCNDGCYDIPHGALATSGSWNPY